MILIDASPLQSEHRFRGPGVYTAGLLDALTLLPAPAASEWALLAQRRHGDDLALLETLGGRPHVATVPLY